MCAFARSRNHFIQMSKHPTDLAVDNEENLILTFGVVRQGWKLLWVAIGLGFLRHENRGALDSGVRAGFTICGSLLTQIKSIAGIWRVTTMAKQTNPNA